MKRLIKADTTPENTVLTVGDFITQVKGIYNQYFPHSECYAANLKVLGMEFLQIRWFLSADKSECAHNIRNNDLFSISFNIDLKDTTESGKVYEATIYDNSSENNMPMPTTIVLEVMNKHYWLAPNIPNRAYSWKNLPYRKTTGTPEKILSVLDRYAQILHKSVAADLNNGLLPENYVKMVDEKLF